jgi:hypothetical protein
MSIPDHRLNYEYSIVNHPSGESGDYSDISLRGDIVPAGVAIIDTGWAVEL